MLYLIILPCIGYVYQVLYQVCSCTLQISVVKNVCNRLVQFFLMTFNNCNIFHIHLYLKFLQKQVLFTEEIYNFLHHRMALFPKKPRVNLVNDDVESYTIKDINCNFFCLIINHLINCKEYKRLLFNKCVFY